MIVRTGTITEPPPIPPALANAEINMIITIPMMYSVENSDKDSCSQIFVLVLQKYFEVKFDVQVSFESHFILALIDKNKIINKVK
jgi:hypothetical protein